MNLELIEKNAILNLTINFSLSVIEYCEKLESDRKYIVAKQLLKSGTSVGANSFEAQNCESAADFIHKFKVAAKERIRICECELDLQFAHAADRNSLPALCKRGVGIGILDRLPVHLLVLLEALDVRLGAEFSRRRKDPIFAKSGIQVLI